MKTIVVLGGYGNFGKRVVEHLLDEADLQIVIAGRNLDKAKRLKEKLTEKSCANLVAVCIDINSDDFVDRLIQLKPDIVIHTSGPFQGQGYHVPLACISAGAHFIDLADDRSYVVNIERLDAEAKDADVLLASGASSVPGLSSAVVDSYQADFAEIHNLDIAIAPGNRAERGEATVRAILSYTGKKISVFKRGEWRPVYGWMNPRKVDFGDIIGKRWLANVDVPDLAIFPQRYRVKDSVSFQAGLELPILHLTMVAMAYLCKIKLIRSWEPLTKLIVSSSNLFIRMGTDDGAMRVKMSGIDSNNQRKSLVWSLYAREGVGPYIPTISAVILAKKLLSDDLDLRGAQPCVGLFDLAEFEPFAKQLKLYSRTEVFIDDSDMLIK